MAEKKEARLGVFEKYLTLWIALCIIIGLLLGRFSPAFGQYLDSLKFGKLSIPIGMYACKFGLWTRHRFPRNKRQASLKTLGGIN